MRYAIRAYLAPKFYGEMYSVETNDLESAKEYIWDHASRGLYCEMFDNLEEKRYRISPDDFDNCDDPSEVINDILREMKFYIETINDSGTGMKYSTKEDFLSEISRMIDDCIKNGATFFDVQVDSDVSCFYEEEKSR